MCINHNYEKMLYIFYVIITAPSLSHFLLLQFHERDSGLYIFFCNDRKYKENDD